MSLKEIATQTLHILDTGNIVLASGECLSLEPALSQAINGTRLYTPQQAIRLLASPELLPGKPAKIEVTDETTQVAARRLVREDSISDLVLLNFASARNPGGGFLNGAKAQEEDLARCSGLYRCLLTQPAYYEANRNDDSVLYTDHMIYSPLVPWFRTRSHDAPDAIFLASVITAPAPNAGVALQRDLLCGSDIETALRQRAGLVLAVASHEGHRNLLLGAWGCGVFRNSPAQVADAFGKWLDSDRFTGSFDRVVFAVRDRTANQSTLAAFQRRFSGLSATGERWWLNKDWWGGNKLWPPSEPEVLTGQSLRIHRTWRNHGNKCAEFAKAIGVSAFVRLREMIVEHKERARKTGELERKSGDHDERIMVLVEAIRQLMDPKQPPKARRIGFYADKPWQLNSRVQEIRKDDKVNHSNKVSGLSRQ
jgi:uncharacterized protein (TIGR02452 family)